MSRTTRKPGSKPTRMDAPVESFDDEGVRLAILAALEAVYECFPHITLPQYLITLEVRKAERDGNPHTLASIVKNERNEPNEIPRAIGRAMMDYYGEAVRQLRALA